MWKKFLTKEKIEDFDSLEVGKQAELFNKFNVEEKARLEVAISAKASKEDIDKLRSDIAENTQKQFDALNEVLKIQGVQIKKAQNKSNVNIKDALKAELKANIEGLKALKDGGKANVVIKAVGDMSLSGNTTGQIPQAFRNPVINDTRVEAVKLLDVVTTGAIGSNLYEWVYVANEEGGAGMTTEGAIKSQYDFELIEASQKVQKITSFITITDEMLDDVEGINTLINTKLTRNLRTKLEAQVYSGDNIAPNLNGITNMASAFSAGSLAGTVDNANEVDVLISSITQVRVANGDEPTAIVMHPEDIAKLEVTKVSATDKRYVDKLTRVAGELSLNGVPIIPTTLASVGTYSIGAMFLDLLLFKQGINIEIGYNADNFVKNYKTIRGELRAVNVIETNDRTSFVTGVFATDKASLETA